MSIQLQSTSDNDEAVTSALGEPKVEEKETETTNVVETKSDSESSDEIEDASEDLDDNEEIEEEEKKVSKSKKRMTKLYGKIGAAEERAIRAEERVKYLEQQAIGGNAAQVKTQSDDRPDQDDFDDYDDYTEALTDWKVDKALQKQSENISKTKAQEKHSSLQNEFISNNKIFSETKEDYQEVMEDVDNIFVPNDIQASIFESENGPELLYELAKNPDEFERICSLSPLRAAKALGKFESKLDLKENTEAKKSIKSKAPKPMSSIRGGGSTSKGASIYDKNMSQKDFEKMRAKDRGDRLY